MKKIKEIKPNKWFKLINYNYVWDNQTTIPDYQYYMIDETGILLGSDDKKFIEPADITYQDLLNGKYKMWECE